MNFRMMARIVLLAAFAMTAGCAARGPAFQEITDIPQGKGLVYVYRPNSILGSAVRYSVYVNDEVVCKLIRGGYCLHYADPGEVEFWSKTESKGSITVDVKAGQKQYVKGGLSMGIAVGRPNLSLVEEEEAMKEIVKCRLLKSPGTNKNEEKREEPQP